MTPQRPHCQVGWEDTVRGFEGGRVDKEDPDMAGDGPGRGATDEVLEGPTDRTEECRPLWEDCPGGGSGAESDTF